MIVVETRIRMMGPEDHTCFLFLSYWRVSQIIVLVNNKPSLISHRLRDFVVTKYNFVPLHFIL